MKPFIFYFICLLGGFFAFGHQAHLTIWMAGDSTMAIKAPDKFPETGWGMPFATLFNAPIQVENKAMNGRSTLSFITEKRWQAIYQGMKKGDYVLIQFGHNDEKITKPGVGTSLAAYKKNLSWMIQQSREKGAHPILLTPIARRNFVQGILTDTHGDYPQAMRQVADSLQVPLIDLTVKTNRLLSSLGEEDSKQLFLHVEPGDKNYPEGVIDNTHLNVEGAMQVAKLVMAGFREQGIALADFAK